MNRYNKSSNAIKYENLTEVEQLKARCEELEEENEYLRETIDAYRKTYFFRELITMLIVATVSGFATWISVKNIFGL